MYHRRRSLPGTVVLAVSHASSEGKANRRRTDTKEFSNLDTISTTSFASSDTLACAGSLTKAKVKMEKGLTENKKSVLPLQSTCDDNKKPVLQTRMYLIIREHGSWREI
jgi:hypothetical protein